MTITSSHNQRLKEIRKLRMRRRERERAGRFVAEGEDLLRGRRRRRLAAARALLRRRQRAARRRGRARSCSPRRRGSRPARGRSPSTRSGGRRPAIGPVCVYLHGVHDPGNVGAVLRVRRGVRRLVRRARAREARIRSAPRPSGRAWARCSACRWRGPRSIDALPGLDDRARGGRGRRAGRTLAIHLGHSELKRREGLTLLIGSERDGLPTEVVASAEATAHIPIHIHSLNAAMAATVALYEVTRITPAP